MLSDLDLNRIQVTLDRLPDASTVNATILELATPGTVDDDYGEPTGDGTIVWTGEVGAHLQRGRELDDPTRTTAVSSQGSTLVEADELVVLRFALPEVVTVVPGEAGVGWTVLFDDLRSGTPDRRRARITGVVTDGQASLADKIRLQLDTEQAGT